MSRSLSARLDIPPDLGAALHSSCYRLAHDMASPCTGKHGYPNRQVFLSGVGKEFQIPLAAMVADHGKTGNAVSLPVVIQNIGESPVHLVGFAGLCGGVPAATVSQGRSQLAFGGNEVFAGGGILYLQWSSLPQNRPVVNVPI